MQRYALFSVTNKDNLVPFAQIISKTHKIIASGGTGAVLKNAGLEVIDVSDYTGSPEMFEGRVKTLHPKIHGGILYNNTPEDLAEVETYEIDNIDLVVCNLYDFQGVVASGGELDEAIEKIDIGGPTLIRAAAKNHQRVIVVTDISDYDYISENIDNLTQNDRMTFALKAFELVTEYDTAISNYLNQQTQNIQVIPNKLLISAQKQSTLKYGENPHQQAAIYQVGDNEFYENLTENPVSFNNILDLSAGWFLSKEFEKPACVIVKHRSPCGVAVSDTVVQAYLDALETDKMSAYGGVYVFNTEIDEITARELVKMFVDLLIAPSYTQEALQILQSKEKMKILKSNQFDIPKLDIQQIPSGFVIQERDLNVLNADQIHVVSKTIPTNEQMESLKFAWKVVKHSRSNAIAICKENRALGIGSGQTSRVDATQSAIDRAGDEVKEAVLASDAFFPFPDSIEKAASVGISAIIAPKGSIRDQQVIDAADKHGIVLVFTSVRSFKH